MKLQSLFILVLTLMIPVLSYAQDGGSMVINGTVRSANGYGMSNVVIRLNDYYFVTATTNESGAFSLTVNPTEISTTMNAPVDSNELKLTANLGGYYPQTKILNYSAGASADFVFELKPLSYEDAQNYDANGNNQVISVAPEPVEE